MKVPGSMNAFCPAMACYSLFRTYNGELGMRLGP